MGSLCGLKWGGRCFIKDWVRFWMGFNQNIVLPPNLANFWYSSTSKSIKSNKSTWGNWRQEQYEVDNEWFSFLDQFFPVRIEGCLLDIKQSFQVAVIFFPQWIFKDNLLRKNFREVFIFNKKLFSFLFSFSTHQVMQLIPPQLVDAHILLLVHILQVVVATHPLAVHILRNLDFLMQDMEEVILKAEENIGQQ